MNTWAVTPSLAEYDSMTTTHLIGPDCRKPYAPSGISRNDVVLWQYGEKCHPIEDDYGVKTTFNVDLARTGEIMRNHMF